MNDVAMIAVTEQDLDFLILGLNMEMAQVFSNMKIPGISVASTQDLRTTIEILETTRSRMCEARRLWFHKK